MNSLTRSNYIIRRNVENKIYPLLRNYLAMEIKGLHINSIQKRNLSIQLDQNPYLAQETFFSQHRPLVFNKIKLEIKTIKSKSTLEPVPFTKIISTKCNKYDDMGYISGSTTSDSSIAAAWDILDCLFTGHVSSSSPTPNESEEISSSQNDNNMNCIETIQPLKSICEDTYLSYFNTNDDILSQDDDIDIDILFSQITKSSQIGGSSYTSSNDKSLNKNTALSNTLSTNITNTTIKTSTNLSTNTTNTTTSNATTKSSKPINNTHSKKELQKTNSNTLSSLDNNISKVNTSASPSSTSSTSSSTPTSPKQQSTKSKPCISKSIMETLKK